jgi:hypothetical protein
MGKGPQSAEIYLLADVLSRILGGGSDVRGEVFDAEDLVLGLKQMAT